MKFYITYNDHKYTKILKDLKESQLSMFDNLEKFDIHDQAKIQSCFDNIYSYITDLFEYNRRTAFEGYKTELSQYELGHTSNVISIQSILSENTMQNNSYVLKIELQVQSLKADTSSLIEKQKRFK